ncbi:hypothetical protein ACJX0J_041293, partial [Zea mays]
QFHRRYSSLHKQHVKHAIMLATTKVQTWLNQLANKLYNQATSPFTQWGNEWVPTGPALGHTGDIYQDGFDHVSPVDLFSVEQGLQFSFHESNDLAKIIFECAYLLMVKPVP